MTDALWKCPLCGTSAPSARDHLAEAHGLGTGAPDRFGLRDATRPSAPPNRPSSRPRPTPPESRQLDGPIELRPRPRPHRRPLAAAGREPEVKPAKRAPLPPDAAILRLICETLEGVDAARLHDRLVALPGVESATIDLYGRTIDLYLDHERATPSHLVTLATARLRLPVETAEIHRAAPRGMPLGDATRIYVVS
ncbi:MAG: hypothetical protein IT305_14000 [Chloroflexi bacterium]|nr:hypothetical protein [Chloroflexota bacterium]